VHDGLRRVAREQIAERVWRCDGATLADEVVRHSVMPPSSVLVRKQLLDAIGGSDEWFRGNGEDIELELRILAQTNALYVDLPLTGYRRHVTSMSADRTSVRAASVKVAERVLSDPARYLPSTVSRFQREYPTLLFGAGRIAAAVGDHANARRYLRQSLGIRRWRWG
jgi:hypothetical protein